MSILRRTPSHHSQGSRFKFQLGLAHIWEYDEGSVTPAWELGKLTGALDPYNHPQSMHARVTSAGFAGETWFDFIIHQTAGSSESFRLPSSSGEFQSLEDDIILTNEEYTLGLPIVQEEFRTTDVTLTRQAAWRYFTNGGFYTLTSANFVITDTRTEHLSYLRKFVDGTKFRELEPHQELVNRGSCLANPGHEYVVYLSGGGRVSLDLSAPSGIMQAQWYNPRIGKYQSPTIRTDEEKHTFVAPDTLDWVLHVRTETH